MAEELYDHRGEDATLGTGEIVNLAYNNEFSYILLELRVKLYDYLWYNSSFEHLFQKHSNASENYPITAGRVHEIARPHTLIHPTHFYSHHSESNGKKIAMGIPVGFGQGFLSSTVHNPNQDKSKGYFRTPASGLIDVIARAEIELMGGGSNGKNHSGSSHVGLVNKKRGPGPHHNHKRGPGKHQDNNNRAPPAVAII